MKPSALVIENDPLQLALFERGLIDLGMVVTSATGFGRAVAEKLIAEQHSIALLDYDLGPGPTGIDVAKFIRAQSSRTKLVLVTSFVDAWMQGPNTRNIFVEVVNKREIQTLEGFKALITPAIRGLRTAPAQAQIDRAFSKTNLRVWHLLALGLTNHEIAHETQLSVKSIEKAIGQLAVAMELEHGSGNLRVNLVRKYVERNGQLPSR